MQHNIMYIFQQCNQSNIIYIYICKQCNLMLYIYMCNLLYIIYQTLLQLSKRIYFDSATLY